MTRLDAYPPEGYPEEGYPFPEEAVLHENITFFSTEETTLHLDILAPKVIEAPLPTVIWIHGGGWKFGDRRAAFERVFELIPHGFCAVAVDYRKSDAAIFPAQIQDVNASIRWLKAHGKSYGIDPDKMALWGGSSGAHLACLAALATHVKDFHAPGFNERYSTEVKAVVNMFGPTDLRFLDNFPEGVTSKLEHHSEKSFEGQLLGGNLRKIKDKVKLASPVFYAENPGSAFLHLHGKQDDIVPYTQSVALHKELLSHSQESELVLFEAGKHNAQNWPPDYTDRIKQFLLKHLKD